MSKVTGQLVKIYSKSGTNAKGKWTAYRLGVDLGTGELEWFNCGFEAPKVTEGSRIAFNTKADDRGGRAVDGAISVDKTQSAAPASGGNKNNFRRNDDEVQNSIVRQNATTSAYNIARDMIQLEVVKLPAAGKRYDFYLELIDRVTNHLYVQNRSPKTVEELASEGLDDSAVDMGSAEDEDWIPV